MNRIPCKILSACAALAALASCRQEAQVPDGMTVEHLTALIGREDASKATVDGSTGAFAWEAGDQVALHTSAGKYNVATLDADGGFNISLGAGVTRNNYGVYPYSFVCNADGTVLHGLGHDGSLDVLLPASYDINIQEGGYASQVLLPMVADNPSSQTELYFYHTAGLLRITVNSVPATTSRIAVTLDGTITGKFSVSGAGTSSPSIAASGSAGTATVTYNLADALTATTNGIVLNVPVPPVTFSSITVSAQDDAGTVGSVSASFSATFSRAHGKKLTAGIVDGTIQWSNFSIGSQPVGSEEYDLYDGWGGGGSLIWDNMSLAAQPVVTSTYASDRYDWGTAN